MSIEDELEEAGRNMQQDTERLGELGKAVTQMLDLRMKVAEAENALAEVKRQYHALAIGTVPDIMAELGLKEVQTQHGVKIVVAREVQCKFIPEVKDRGLEWLEEHNYGALIKHEVSVEFGKDSEAAVARAVAALNDAGFEPDVSRDVHAMTLKAWGKRQVEDGATIPSELFSVNTFSIAKVRA
jgi:hypothetical protein